MAKYSEILLSFYSSTEPQDETADHPQDETADHLQDETTDHPPLDVEGLKRAWENEKLALLDAIQSLKELLIQTATGSAVSCS